MSDPVTPGAVADALANRSVPVGPDTDLAVADYVEEIDVAAGTVTVDASLDGLDPAAADELEAAIRGTILELPGVEAATVAGEAHAHDHGDAHAHDHHGHGGHAGHDAHAHDHDDDCGDDCTCLDGVDRILAVASAKGGVGKTTVATQLARGLAATGESVGLFDADVYGPNVPTLLSADGPMASTDDGRAKPIESDGLQAASVGWIANDEPLAWRGAMAHEAVQDLLTDTAWDVDTLVLDLPPGTGDIVLTTLQEIPVDGVVLVTTPFPTAASDTDRSATLFADQGVPVLGAVVNMAGFTCPTCGDEHAPFGHDPEVEADVLAELPIDEDLREVDDEPPGEFQELAGTVRERLVEARPFTVPESALDVRGIPDRARFEQVCAEFDACDPGEELYLVTEREPGPVADVLADETDSPEPAVETMRRGPEEWAIRIEKRAPVEAGVADD
jgi:ATP-binding protein involved in chromosome partitioning